VPKLQNSLGKRDFHAVICGNGKWKPGLRVAAQAAIYAVVLLVCAGGRYEA
jgi:hypothetical protein